MSKIIQMQQTTQRGVALIEVLVCFFVLSIGLLGMAALQMRAMQYNQSSYMRSQATVAANDMMDRIRLNSGAAVSVPAAEFLAWRNALAGIIPSLFVPNTTAVCAGNVCTVTVTWTETAGGQVSQVSVTVITQI